MPSLDTKRQRPTTGREVPASRRHYILFRFEKDGDRTTSEEIVIVDRSADPVVAHVARLFELLPREVARLRWDCEALKPSVVVNEHGEEECAEEWGGGPYQVDVAPLRTGQRSVWFEVCACACAGGDGGSIHFPPPGPLNPLDR